MIIRMRLRVDDDTRRAIASRISDKGLATRKTVVAEFECLIDAHVETILWDYERKDRNDDG